MNPGDVFFFPVLVYDPAKAITLDAKIETAYLAVEVVQKTRRDELVVRELATGILRVLPPGYRPA